ncbi:MAG: GNAT family N-acetyltransferase [Planctomycetes bacterium]|nr:GNAT family N-acetyltransferase [Planctomycetota bacterium]
MSGASVFELSVVRDAAGVLALRGEWDALWQRSTPRHVFLAHGWQRAALRAYPERRPLVIVARRGGALAGVLPLAEAGGTLRFLGAPWADYNDVLVDPALDGGAILALLEALLLCAAKHGGAVLDNVREDAVLARLRGRTRLGAVALALRFRCRCPTVIVGDGVIEELVKKKSLVRHEKKLARLGAVALHDVTGREAIAAQLPEFFAQHSRRRAFAGDGLVFREPAARAFFGALFDELGPEQAVLSVLRCGDRSAAMHVGFVSDGGFLWYKPTFDVELWDLGPGEVLLKHLLASCRRRGSTEFDFTIGEEDFKFRFANRTREAWTIHVLAPGLRGLRGGLALRARAAIQRRPRLAATLRRLRARLAGGHAPQDGVRALAAVTGARSSSRVCTSRELGLAELADRALAGTPGFGAHELSALRRRQKDGAVFEIALDGRAVALASCGALAALARTARFDAGFEPGPNEPLLELGWRVAGLPDAALRSVLEALLALAPAAAPRVWLALDEGDRPLVEAALRGDAIVRGRLAPPAQQSAEIAD